MNTESSTPRARQLWSHLLGFFGSDAVERKFGLEPPAEWSAALSALSDAQLRAGVEALSKSGAAFVPTLPQFLGMCRSAREWSHPLPQLTDGRFDGWARAGNFHLLAYLRDRNQPKRYAPDSPAGCNPGPQTALRTQCLVQAKNRWAQCMRETAAEEHSREVDVPTQQAVWKLEMARAEREIDGLIATERAAA